MSLLHWIVLLASLWMGGARAGLAQEPYSTDPLERGPLMEYERVRSHATNALGWLDENYARLPQAQWPQVREDLYGLIASVAQRQYQQAGAVGAPEDIPSATRLFSWANRVGVYGADLIAASLADSSQADSAAQAVPPFRPDSLFEVTYDAPFLRFGASDAGWSVRVPYYFMTWQLSRGAVQEHPTDILVTSTLPEYNRTDEYASQSTLMLMVSEQDCDGFIPVLKQYGALGSGEPSTLVEGGTLYRVTPNDGIHNKVLAEFLVWSQETTCVVVHYSGLPGPFEANYVHFGDFVRAIDL
ncbi:MAG: hypothetical protein AAF624_10050 [Bacteroidota bacterium]